MANTNKNGKSFTKNLTMVAILTAITVVLQIVALVSRPFLPFSITLSLFPIVIGAALCGPVTSSLARLCIRRYRASFRRCCGVFDR